MKQGDDAMVKSALGFFFVIFGGALLAALAGGLFGALIAAISPEFVVNLHTSAAAHPVRYALAMGAIWGLFIGALAAAFACFLAAVIRILRIRFERTAG